MNGQNVLPSFPDKMGMSSPLLGVGVGVVGLCVYLKGPKWSSKALQVFWKCTSEEFTQQSPTEQWKTNKMHKYENFSLTWASEKWNLQKSLHSCHSFERLLNCLLVSPVCVMSPWSCIFRKICCRHSSGRSVSTMPPSSFLFKRKMEMEIMKGGHGCMKYVSLQEQLSPEQMLDHRGYRVMGKGSGIYSWFFQRGYFKITCRPWCRSSPEKSHQVGAGNDLRHLFFLSSKEWLSIFHPCISPPLWQGSKQAKK